MELYRYEIFVTVPMSYEDRHRLIFRNVSLNLRTYNMIKETKKGYWIDHFGGRKWVSKTSKKRFAYPTKEEALSNFIKRSNLRKKILENTISDINEALGYALKLKENEII